MSTQTTRLASGIRVVTETMPEVRTAALGVWAEGGSRVETPRTNGIAHLLEHMAFKGTERRSAREIAEEIEAVGGHLNAYTAREHTAYYARVMADDVPLALDILADILQHSVFDPEELERERAVVLQEIAQLNDTPDELVFEHFQAAAYPGQPLGWSILGPAAQVAAYDRDSLRRFMAEHYTASRLVVVAAGAVDHQQIVALADAYFREIDEHPATAFVPAAYVGGEHIEARDLEQTHLVVGFESVSARDPDYYASQVLSALLGGGMSSRLFQEIREKRGLAYAVFSFGSAYVDDGLFGVYTGTAPDKVAELVPVLCDQCLAVCEGVKEEEVARARAQLKAGLLMSLESSSARCERLGRHMLVFQRPIPVEETLAEIDAVDTARLTATARRIIAASTPAVAALGPSGATPEAAEIAERLGSAAQGRKRKSA